MDKLVDTVGMEFEFDGISQRNLGSFRVSPNLSFKVKHDASCESRYPIIGNLPITNISLGRIETIGGELVSNKIDTENEEAVLEDLKSFVKIVRDKGEPDESQRASIHFHVNVGNSNIQIVKNMLKVSAFLEQLFFLIGTMGYKYRGKFNNSTYCRPITKNGPVYVPVGKSKWSRSFELNRLLQANTTSELLYLYGDYTNMGERLRYIPVRYTAFNIIPIYTQGSMEFRVFNKTLNPYFIWSAMMLCKAAVKTALTFSEVDFGQNSIYDIRSKNDVKDHLELLKQVSYINGMAYEILTDMIYLADLDSVMLEEDKIICHLCFHPNLSIPNHWTGGDIPYPIEGPDTVIRPNFVDVRIQEGELNLKRLEVDLSRYNGNIFNNLNFGGGR